MNQETPAWPAQDAPDAPLPLSGKRNEPSLASSSSGTVCETDSPHSSPPAPTPMQIATLCQQIAQLQSSIREQATAIGQAFQTQGTALDSLAESIRDLADSLHDLSVSVSETVDDGKEAPEVGLDGQRIPRR